MKQDNQFFEKSFKCLNEGAIPTNEQKDRILSNVLLKSVDQRTSPLAMFKNFVTVYPWRFAFGAATLQTIVCTEIFGAKYINFILGIIGG